MQRLHLPHLTRFQWLAFALLLVDVGLYVFHIDFTGWASLLVYWPPLLVACFLLIPKSFFKKGRHVTESKRCV